MSTYTYDIGAASAVYRSPLETARAQTIPYNVVGDPPQWGDNSDASYADCAAEIITEGTSSTGETTRPSSDFGAHPEVDQVDGLKVRMQQAVYGSEGFFGQIQWVLRNKNTNAVILAAPTSGTQPDLKAPPSPETRSYPISMPTGGLALLQSGDLAVEVMIYSGEFGSRIRVFDVWLTIGSETPPPEPPAVVTYLPHARLFPRSDGMNF